MGRQLEVRTLTDVVIVFRKELKELLYTRRALGLWLVQLAIFLGVFGIYFPATQRSLWLSGSAWAAMFYLFVPAFIANAIVADSFAGERERKTLETLLATPLSEMAILLGKALAAFSYAWGVVLICQLGALITLNVVKETNGLFLFTPLYIFLATAGSGLLTALAIELGLFISLRAQSVREAQQVSSLIWFALVFAFPILLPHLVRQAGEPTWESILGASAILLLVEVFLVRLVLRAFQRECLVLL